MSLSQQSGKIPDALAIRMPLRYLEARAAIIMYHGRPKGAAEVRFRHHPPFWIAY